MPRTKIIDWSSLFHLCDLANTSYIFLWTEKSGSPSVNLSNASKNKIHRNLFLIGDNVAELHYQTVLLNYVLGKVSVHQHLSDSVAFSSIYFKT